MKTLAHQIEPAPARGGSLTFSEFNAAYKRGDFAQYDGEEKFDGVRYLFQIRPNKAKQNYLTSRRISSVTNLFSEKQDKVPHVRDMRFPYVDTILDGEWLAPGGGFSGDAQSALAQGVGRYVCWDMLMLNGEDIRKVPLTDRRTQLRIMFGKSCPEWFSLVPCSKRPDRLLQRVIRTGGEGLILKTGLSKYGEDWWKVKAVEFFDAVIVGFKMSSSDKYGPKGWIKGVEIGQYVEKSKWTGDWLGETKINNVPHYLIYVGRISGMTEQVRDFITKNQKQLLNQVVELKAQFRLPSGLFRHPRWRRLRPDKSQHQCVWLKK